MDIWRQLNELPPETLNAIVAGAISVGTLYCFLGYRTLKIVIALLGFILAGSVAAALAAWISQGHTVATIAGGLAGGIAGAMALFFLYKAGVFLLGLLLGVFLGLNLLAGVEQGWSTWVVLGVGLAGGILGLLLERPIVTLATAALGAWMVVSGLAFFILGPPLLRIVEPPLELTETEGVLIAGWFILAIGGAIMQFVTHKRRSARLAGQLR